LFNLTNKGWIYFFHKYLNHETKNIVSNFVNQKIKNSKQI
jgi:hypothetical protein